MRFAFIVHPLSPAMLRIFGLRAGLLPLALGSSRRQLSEGLHPSNIRIITELPRIVGDAGAECSGRIVGLPSLPEVLLAHQEEAVRLMRTAAMQYGVGCELVGLGAVCAIVGLRGEALAAGLPKPVTTGNSLTCWASAETVCKLHAALSARPGFPERVLIVGFPGTMAEALCEVLLRRGLPVEAYHPSFPKRLERALLAMEKATGATIARRTDLPEALAEGGLVVGASSLGGELAAMKLRSGTVVVDVAQPLDTSEAQRRRPGLLVVEGELVAMPQAAGAQWRGALTSAYNTVVGQGAHRVFACLAEPMVLSMEGRRESFSLGKRIDPARVEEIGALATTHGFGVRELYTGRRRLDEGRLAAFGTTGR